MKLNYPGRENKNTFMQKGIQATRQNHKRGEYTVLCTVVNR